MKISIQSVRMKPGMSYPELQVSIPFYIDIVLNKDIPLIWYTKELLLGEEKQVKTQVFIYIIDR